MVQKPWYVEKPNRPFSYVKKTIKTSLIYCERCAYSIDLDRVQVEFLPSQITDNFITLQIRSYPQF
jgi:hypothetical protein